MCTPMRMDFADHHGVFYCRVVFFRMFHSRYTSAGGHIAYLDVFLILGTLNLRKLIVG